MAEPKRNYDCEMNKLTVFGSNIWIVGAWTQLNSQCSSSYKTTTLIAGDTAAYCCKKQLKQISYSLTHNIQIAGAITHGRVTKLQ